MAATKFPDRISNIEQGYRDTLALSKNGERNMGSRLKTAGTTGVVAASFARHSRSPLAGIQFLSFS
jgi:hypothetical protein